MLPGSSRKGQAPAGEGMIMSSAVPGGLPSGTVSLLWVRIEPSGCFWRGRAGLCGRWCQRRRRVNRRRSREGAEPFHFRGEEFG